MKQTVARWLTCGMVLMAAPICSADDAETNATRRDAVIGRRLGEFFEEGFKRGPKVIPDSQRRYESLRAESKNDPRVDYAMGLVL